jgi:adenylate cyclase
MTSPTRDDVARRAGIDSGYLERLIELGIVSADSELSSGDVRRAQLARTLDAAGIAPEDLAEVLRAGPHSLDFMDTPRYERFAAYTDETFQQLSERTGLPLQLVMLVREATGGAVPEPTDRMREDELAVVPLIERRLAMGFAPVSVGRGLRVAGEGFRRLAETESDAWRSDVLAAFIAAGRTASDAAAAFSGEEARHLDEVTDRAMLALWHAQQARAWTSNIIGSVEAAFIEAGLRSQTTRPPAICFLDITGYTRLTQERGDEAAASLAERLGRVVSNASLQHGGRPVKWLGDGVMLHFRDPGPGVAAALDMVDGVAAADLPPAHVGLHTGPVLFQEGDYFGQTVNLAARIAEYARPGEVLVSQAVVDAVTDGAATFTDIGPVELKGVAGTTYLHTARRPA